ncbi:hypothetical protein [Ferruginibacter sp. SUN106]|uniref:hypothetical protein n=1 Tax=Ferruginibacter sp. SUN106 TaxID=2978348 RepID=UPI003D367245
MELAVQSHNRYYYVTNGLKIICLGVMLLLFTGSCNYLHDQNQKEENEMYDGPELAARQEFEKTKDPATGKVPRERLLAAIETTNDLKQLNSQSLIGGLSWIERGPNSDLPGPFGNARPTGASTAGRIRAMMVDSTDATHKTVWVGGVDGGLWRTSDITASPATWVLINDNLSNLAISDICQDPRPGFQNIMYFCTGESYFNIDAVRGNGVFKSTDGGATWSYLASTSTYTSCTRILCDYLGNIYLATRGSGLLRSTVASGGAVWTNITPAGLVSDICDLEISSTSAAGRLHVVAGIFSTQAYRYTDIPVTVAAGTWTAPAVAFPSFNNRAEICVSGNTLYSLVADAGNQVPTIYKSTDGGANWAATGGQPAVGWASQQGWYALSAAIDPSSGGTTCIVGGLDTWKTTNGGTSWTKISSWVTSTGGFYVHADQHDIQWWDGGNKLMFGCDGGAFFSSDKGVSMSDRNKGLRIKQFFSCAIHPSTTNYFLAGAQDNGVHQFSNAGLSSTVEVTGGDGGYTAIDQDQPQYQFGSYVYNQYQRSTDGGATWASVNLSASTGQFINPFDYDNTANIMYCGDAASSYRRWTDPQTGSTSAVINVSNMAGSVTAVSVSPYTANRVYFGTNSGKVMQVDGANTFVSASAGTDRSTGLPGGTVSCINFGTSDLNLMCCESNYGINNIWVSSDGGATWTAIDGNLPDMPVRWCMFYPGSNTKAFIATETGVWQTDLVNGASTVWNANPTFPSVRTDMIKYRSADRTIAAATHGRGLWTATIPTVATPDLSFQTAAASATEYTTFKSGCRGYTDYTYYMVIANSPSAAGTVTLAVAGGATATNGVDYAVTTNGNFAAPSMTLNFAGGSGTAQPFTIRVYDDDAVESAESFTLNYTVTGGNAQAGVANQTLAFTINDNDAAPLTSSSNTQTVGTLSSNLGSALFNSALQSKRVQMLYKASELTSLGLVAGNITAIQFYIGVKNSTRAFTNLTIKMGGTTTANLVNGSAFVQSTAIVKNPFTYSTVLGYNNFTFDVPFAWNGTDNIAVELCYDNGTADGTQTSDQTYGYSDCGSCPALGNMFWQDGINCSGSFGSVSLYFNDLKPTIKLTQTVTGTPVSTTITSKVAYLGPNDDVPFYDASGNIMARIKNNTAFDYGCTTIDIDRAGTAATAFWNNTPANYLTNKSFKVTPTNANPTGNYDITLYYSAAEKAGYEAATGQSWTGVSMVKAVGPISGITPANQQVSTVTVNGVVTQATFGSDYTVKATFTNGFSGFAVGKPGAPLPITLLSFTGYVKDNYGVLDWTTSSENNNKGFDLEKSYDGINFTKIAFVPGAGTSSTLRQYQYLDKTRLSNIQYYRLKQIDFNQKEVYSDIVLLKLTDRDNLELISVTNPFNNSINMMFSKPLSGSVAIKLFDLGGRLIYSDVRMPGITPLLQLSVPPLFSAGTYILSIENSKQQFNRVIIKQ